MCVHVLMSLTLFTFMRVPLSFVIGVDFPKIFSVFLNVTHRRPLIRMSEPNNTSLVALDLKERKVVGERAVIYSFSDSLIHFHFQSFSLPSPCVSSLLGLFSVCRFSMAARRHLRLTRLIFASFPVVIAQITAFA